MLKKLQERLEALKTEARALLDRAITETRALNADEEKRKGEIEAEIRTVESQIKTVQELRLDDPPATPRPVEGRGDNLNPNAPRMNVAVPNTAQQRPRYSLLRALRSASEHRAIDGFEGEVSQEISRRMGRSPQGFFMPMDFADPLGENPERRDLLQLREQRALDLTSGAGAKPTITDPSLFIDILRNRALVRALGATILTGLTGDLSIPKQTGAGTAYWFASESATVTGSSQTVGQIGLAPKTLGAMTDISRKFLIQSSIDAEQFVRNDLAAILAIELDRAVINGSGSGAEPQGILQNSSIGTYAMGTNGLAPDWNSLVQLEALIAAANADVANMAYLTNAKVRGKLKSVPKVSSYPTMLMADDGSVNGYRCGISNQVPSNLTKGTSSGVCSAIIFGDWSQVFIGFWTGLDVLVDPYTGGASGTLRIRMLQDCDIKFRRTESFYKCVDYLTT